MVGEISKSFTYECNVHFLDFWSLRNCHFKILKMLIGQIFQNGLWLANSTMASQSEAMLETPR